MNEHCNLNHVYHDDPDDYYDESDNPSNGWRSPEPDIDTSGWLEAEQEFNQLEALAKALGGRTEGRCIPEFVEVIRESDKKCFIFGYANGNLGVDIYQNYEEWIEGAQCDSDEDDSNNQAKNIAWAIKLVTNYS